MEEPQGLKCASGHQERYKREPVGEGPKQQLLHGAYSVKVPRPYQALSWVP